MHSRCTALIAAVVSLFVASAAFAAAPIKIGALALALIGMALVVTANFDTSASTGLDPLGRGLQFPSDGHAPTVMTVVGVVPAIDWRMFEKERPAGIYVPFAQDFQANLKLHVRVAPNVNPAGLMTTARNELQKLDPRIPLTEVKTLAAMHREGPFARGP